MPCLRIPWRTRQIHTRQGDVAHGDLVLMSVHMIMRHGDTDIYYGKSPAHPLAFDTGLRCNMDSLTPTHPAIAAYEHEMWNITRHGAHYAGMNIYPNTHFCTGENITGIGALQALVLGDYLHHKYMSTGQQWSQHPLTLQDISVVMGHKTRVTKTAVALLNTLLPHLNATKYQLQRRGQPVISWRPHGCIQAWTTLLEAEHLTFSDAYHRNDSVFTNIIQKVSEVYDRPDVLDIAHPWPLLDTMMVLKCHNVRMPCNTYGHCITDDIIQGLWDNLDNAPEYWHNPRNSLKKLRTIRGIRELTEILLQLHISDKNSTYNKKHEYNIHNVKVKHNIKSHQQNSMKLPRFVLHAGHGETVARILEALGLYSQKWPPYASRFVIESYKHMPTGSRLIKFIYNGKDITRDTPFCKDKTVRIDDYEFCTLDAFVEYVSRDIYKVFNASMNAQTCKPTAVLN